MSKKCLVWVWKKPTPPQTNLSISITGADSFVEWVNTQYTIALDLTGYIGSPDTVVTATLPTWITYVSSSDSGSKSGWVVTWNLGTIMVDKNLTLTINSDTPATWYDIDVAVTSSIWNVATATATKEIEVEAPPAWDIEIRVTGAFNMNASDFLTIDVLKVWGISWTSVIWSFTENKSKIADFVVRLWYLNSSSISIWQTLYISGTSTYWSYNSTTSSWDTYTTDPFVLNIDIPE